MSQWTLGYSTVTTLDDQKERVSWYITKYVAREFRKIFGPFYYVGGHRLVRKSKAKVYDLDHDVVETQECKPEGVNIWLKHASGGETDEITARDTARILKAVGGD